MQNEKMENQLNLALDATEQEREKSLDLDVGYDIEENTWEVIVKYTGSGEALQELLFSRFPEDAQRIQITNLSNEYAILVLPEDLVERVAALNEIEYLEKPKRLFLQSTMGNVLRVF